MTTNAEAMSIQRQRSAWPTTSATAFAVRQGRLYPKKIGMRKPLASRRFAVYRGLPGGRVAASGRCRCGRGGRGTSCSSGVGCDYPPYGIPPEAIVYEIPTGKTAELVAEESGGIIVTVFDSHPRGEMWG